MAPRSNNSSLGSGPRSSPPRSQRSLAPLPARPPVAGDPSRAPPSAPPPPSAKPASGIRGVADELRGAVSARGQAILDDLLSQCDDGWLEASPISQPFELAPVTQRSLVPVAPRLAAKPRSLPPPLPRAVTPVTAALSAERPNDDALGERTVPPVAIESSIAPSDPLEELVNAMSRRRARQRAVVFAAMIALPALAWLAIAAAPESAETAAPAQLASAPEPAAAQTDPAPKPAKSAPRMIQINEQVLGNPAHAAATGGDHGLIEMGVKSGRCLFFIDGKPQVTDWRFKIEVTPGVHEAACAIAGGYHRETIRIAAGERKVVVF